MEKKIENGMETGIIYGEGSEVQVEGSVFSSEGLKGSGNFVSSCKGGINRPGLARGLKSASGKLLTKSLEPSAVEFESGFWF